MSQIPARGEIDDSYKWDLESIYSDEDQWHNDLEQTEQLLDQMAEYEGQLTGDSETLLEALRLKEEISRNIGKLSVYARLRYDEDTSREQYQAMINKVQALGSQSSEVKSFITPEIQDAGQERIQELIQEQDELQAYERYFDQKFRREDYTLPQEQEALLSYFGEVMGQAGDFYRTLLDTDMDVPPVEKDGEQVDVSQNSLTSHLKDRDREFREDVYSTFFGELGSFSNTISKMYRNHVKEDVKSAEKRGYDSTRHHSLFGPNIPTEVYDTLLETVRDNLDLLHRHAELKEEALDVDQLQMWDLYMPLIQSEEPEVPFDEAKEHVLEALEPLGEDYVERVREGIEDEGWVDVKENQNKRSGAYSSGTYDTQPFILMNYQDDISSMFTLAHELGHSMHSELASEEQEYVNSGYPIFTAEVASTVNEALLAEHLLENIEDEEYRKHVLNHALEGFRTTLYRQTMFADFEHQVHQMAHDGEPLTSEAIDEVYHDLKQEYYEPAETDEHIAKEWMRIPHFYRSFYVYQYATGKSAANALASQILAEGEPAAERYKDFLRSGSSDEPIELLREAGVDMTSPEPIEEALETYEEHLNEMEGLVKERAGEDVDTGLLQRLRDRLADLR